MAGGYFSGFNEAQRRLFKYTPLISAHSHKEFKLNEGKNLVFDGRWRSPQGHKIRHVHALDFVSHAEPERRIYNTLRSVTHDTYCRERRTFLRYIPATGVRSTTISYVRTREHEQADQNRLLFRTCIQGCEPKMKMISGQFFVFSRKSRSVSVVIFFLQAEKKRNRNETETKQFLVGFSVGFSVKPAKKHNISKNSVCTCGCDVATRVVNRKDTECNYGSVVFFRIFTENVGRFRSVVSCCGL